MLAYRLHSILYRTYKFFPIQLYCTNKSEFKMIYKFPYITGLSIANKMKLYQTALTGVAVPMSTFLHLYNDLSVDMVYCTAALGLFGIIPLYGLGLFTNKLIGIVYYNESKDVVKIAYLDFWGRRKESVIPVKDIIPFSDISHSVTDVAYLKFKQFSNSETKKICVRIGIEKPQEFNKIFSAYFGYFIYLGLVQLHPNQMVFL